jgi:hypothetical protein
LKIAFAAIVILSILPFSLMLRQYTWLTKCFWMAFGALPYMLSATSFLDLGIVSWEDWAGFSPGMEVTILDFMAIVALFVLPLHRTPKIYFFPFLLYLMVLLLSMQQAAEPLAAWFGVWQFARMFLIAAVVARACAFPDVPYLIIKGMTVGVFAQFIAVLWQRFGLGLPQNTGLFIHQNTLGMAIHFALFPQFVLLLTGERNLRYLLPSIGMMLIIVILTASRGTIGFAGAGIVATYLLVALLGLTPRKIAVGFSTLLVAAVVVPATLIAFQSRFEKAPLIEDLYDERAAFNHASLHMMHDFPLGVGVNHYVYIATHLGYSDRAGVAPAEGNRKAIVHNAYLLAGAETGYPGMIAFCFMLFTPLFIALKTGVQRHTEPGASILIGCGMAMLVAYLHSFYEWIIFSKDIQYLLVVTMGLVFGIASREKIQDDVSA